MSQNN